MRNYTFLVWILMIIVLVYAGLQYDDCQAELSIDEKDSICMDRGMIYEDSIKQCIDADGFETLHFDF